ncbi:MAG: alpha amylase N-terminal ig-like domain-containing protein [Planifilum fulgidum]
MTTIALSISLLPAFGKNPTAAAEGLDDNIHWNELKHDTRDPLFRHPFGAVPAGEAVRLRMQTKAGDVESVKLILWDDLKRKQSVHPMTPVGTSPDGLLEYWETTVSSDRPTVFWYHFELQDGSRIVRYGDQPEQDGGIGEPTDGHPHDFQLTVYDRDFRTPDWFKLGITYQIFPDRFYDGDPSNNRAADDRGSRGDAPIEHRKWGQLPDNPDLSDLPGYDGDGIWSNDFYGGDLAGIRKKLDYLESLGVKTLYLNPIFEATSNHKYDTADYERIDRMFGTKEEFELLAREAKKRGMHIVLDGVFNHVGDDSKYFDRYGKWSDPENRPEEIGAWWAWKLKKEGKWKEHYASPWESWFHINDDGSYEGWWGYDSLPVIRAPEGSELNVKSFADFIIRNDNSITRRWIRAGASGWRLDVAPEVARDFWQALRAHLKGDQRGDLNPPNGEPILITENWNDATYDLLGDTFDSTMNYRFRNAVIAFMLDEPFDDTDVRHRPIDAAELDNRLMDIYESYPREAFYAMMNLMGSHDTMRMMKVYGDVEKDHPLTPAEQKGWSDERVAEANRLARQRVKLTALLQMTYPGSPTIYYGDEAGLTGFDDPDDRRTYPWDNPDTDLLEHYRRLARIRQQHPVLITGDLTTLHAEGDTYVFGRKITGGKDALGNSEYIVNYETGEKRKVTDGAAVIAISKSGGVREVEVGSFVRDGVLFRDVWNDREYRVEDGKLRIELQPMDGAILIAAPGQDLTPPPEVERIRATGKDGQVHLTWHPVRDAKRYEILRSPIDGGYEVKVGESKGASFTDRTVKNGKRYHYRIIAVDAAGNRSESGAAVSAVPHAPIQSAVNRTPKADNHVIGVEREITAIGQVTVKGVTGRDRPSHQVLAEVGFKHERDKAFTWQTARFDRSVKKADQYTATFPPDRPGTWKVVFRFSTSLGEKWTETPVVRVTAVPSDDREAPPAPVLHQPHQQSRQVALKWDPVKADDLAFYEVERQTVTEGRRGEWQRIARVGADQTAYTDTTVENGTTYRYRVLAVDTSFNRSESNPVQVTPKETPVRVTFRVKVPEYTGTDHPVRLAGTFPQAEWNPGAEELKMAHVGDNTWEKSLELMEGTRIEYKYARGSWDRVEKGEYGEELPNRTLTVKSEGDGRMLVTDEVKRWRDIPLHIYEPADGTRTGQARILLRGDTYREAELTVNGETRIHEGGPFERSIPLSAGENAIVVRVAPADPDGRGLDPGQVAELTTEVRIRVIRE